ncbi:DNA replication licensing factor Mcm7 [Amphibalanus amphitrite]|uniref:DNA replication licensing factor Mcm7 n=1 Tax=Amphibalanus amphitrite TaxID=1232801 RepID=A0A6A4X3K6_AMPAM|nr:DNA replication licensing factor Mcm7 [Amphibalanus amphitrite]
MASRTRDYEQEKAKLRQFLVEFHVKEGRRKDFKYASQLTSIAHREQVLLTIDLDDVDSFDQELAEAVVENARRYTALMSDVVADLLPEYRTREEPS